MGEPASGRADASRAVWFKAILQKKDRRVRRVCSLSAALGEAKQKAQEEIWISNSAQGKKMAEFHGIGLISQYLNICIIYPNHPSTPPPFIARAREMEFLRKWKKTQFSGAPSH
jgi:hypothetical protein